jgi:hypothetical protein
MTVVDYVEVLMCWRADDILWVRVDEADADVLVPVLV